MSFFIVIDGQDGAGIGTQAEILREKLMARGHILFLRYPNYNSPVGKAIYDFLHERIRLSREIVFLLYAIDQLKDKEKINKTLEKNEVVLTDRYFTTNLAYQCTLGFGLDKALKFAEMFEMPRPDLVIFLKVSPETGIKRKIKEKGKGDIYERDIEFQRKIGKKYQELINKNIFAKEWVVVDGEKSVEEVAKEIEKIVFSKLKGD